MDSRGSIYSDCYFWPYRLYFQLPKLVIEGGAILLKDRREMSSFGIFVPVFILFCYEPKKLFKGNLSK